MGLAEAGPVGRASKGGGAAETYCTFNLKRIAHVLCTMPINLMAVAEGDDIASGETTPKMDKSRLERFESGLSAKEEGLTLSNGNVRSSLSNRGAKMAAPTTGSPAGGAKGEVAVEAASPLKDNMFVRQDSIKRQNSNKRPGASSVAVGKSSQLPLLVLLGYLLVCVGALCAGSAEPMPTTPAEVLSYVPRSLGLVPPPPEPAKKRWF